MKFGLDTMTRLCAALGHPERHFTSVLVAGTNGKGSVTAMVHQGLVTAGHHAARYISPHLERLEERYVIGNREIETAALRDAAAAVQRAVERLLREGRLDAPPTFFECATAIGFELFRTAAVRVAVLEVGLGGRLDATNVVDPVAAAITSIDFDHQALLGDTLDAIAAEKAGIARPGIPVVCGTLPPEAMAAVERTCARVGARPVSADACVDVAQLTGGRPLALRGRHQQANAAVAGCLLRELDGLGIAAGGAAIRAALTETTWPGRLERLSCGGTAVLLDAAHNAAGARALADYLRETGWADATLVFGVVQDKDAAAMLAALATVCRAIICTTPSSARATPADVLLEAARRTPGAEWTASAIPDPQAALHAAVRMSRRVVVAGSIFLIGPLRGILRAS